MDHEYFDEGLVHGHDWSSAPIERSAMLTVADATSVNTPSSVFHDDVHHAE